MALPATIINSEDVRVVLGASSNKWKHLCTHPNINKWSKWKPVSFNKIEGLTATELKSVNFGLSYTPSVSYISVVNGEWIYTRPTGGASSSYRIGDFRNYNKDAIEPMTAPDTTFNRTIQTECVFDLSITRGGTSNLIGIDDLPTSVGNYYYGVIITDGNSVYIQTAASNLIDGGSMITIPRSFPLFSQSGVTLTVYHILSNTMISAYTDISMVSPQPLYLPLLSSSEKTKSLTVDYGIRVDTTFSRIGTTVNLSSVVDNYITTRYAQWTTGRIYYVGDKVKNGSSYYECVVNHASGDFTTDLFTNGYWVFEPNANQYFATGGNLYLTIRFTNTSQSDISIPYNYQIGVSKTFFNTQYTLNANTYDVATKSQITTPITVPASGYIDVIIGGNDVLNRNGAIIQTPASGIQIDSQIELRYNGDSLKSETINFESV